MDDSVQLAGIERALTELRASIDDEAKIRREANEAALQAVKKSDQTRRRSMVTFAVVLTFIIGVGVRSEVEDRRQQSEIGSTQQQMLSDRDQGRCNVRAGFIDIANAGHASEALTLGAIRDYDRRQAELGAKPCGGVAECVDGTYTLSVGRGACSHHGGVRKILVKPPK